MFRPFKVYCFLLLLLCNRLYAQTGPLFQLLSPKQTGIRFSNEINESENLNVLAYEYFYNGGGVAIGDINNDGLDDILFTANMGDNKLYLNQGNLKFKDITRQASRELEGRKGAWKTGATMADINGDGLLDIYICYSGKTDDASRRNQLFINKGDLHFSEEAAQYGLDDPSYSTQAAFFDFDNDGDLDMFLLNHSTKKIDNMELARYRDEVDPLAGDKLYENVDGHFTDITSKTGIRQNPLTFGLGVAIGDINQDGWPDIYVTNDYAEQDYLYINNGDKTFRDETTKYFNHLSEFSMGVDIADFNNDAHPDVMTLDMLPESNKRQKLLQLPENYESFQLMLNQNLHKQYMRNMLQLNNGDGTFSEIGQAAGVSNSDWSWCPLLTDFDNDGYKDIFISNGYLRDYTNKDFLRYWGDYKIKKAMDREPVLLMDLIKSMPVTTLQNYIYRNNQDLTFSNMQNSWGLTEKEISSGAAYADLDNDGDLDLVINNINQNAFLYENKSRQTNNSHFLSLQLRYKNKNLFATGAKVFLYQQGTVQYQEVNPSRGYLSCMPARLHFGLINNAAVDSIVIIWPDAAQQVETSVQPDQFLEINYNPTRAATPFKPASPAEAPYFTATDPGINYHNESGDLNDFKRQPLMLFMYSHTTPVMATADLNKDGREDLFIAADTRNPGRIYLQNSTGKFDAGTILGDPAKQWPTAADAKFFDADGDGDIDLYIAHGGYGLYSAGQAAFQDELWLNDGTGHFSEAAGALPVVTGSSKGCVRVCDYDGDGDNDLFVSGRVLPGRYPETPTSYLLNNDGHGLFSIVKTAFDQAGMITDARWFDIDKDGKKDLLLTGEFMPLKLYLNNGGTFTDASEQYFPDCPKGFWFSLDVADLDGDGKEDIVAGNLGLNSQIKVSKTEPGVLYYSDFDHNGSVDPIFSFYIQGKSYPYVSRDEMNDQIFSMRRKFSSYQEYSGATIQDIFSKQELDSAKKLEVTNLHSMIFLQRNGKFQPAALPLEAQFSAVTKILTADFTGDGHTDILLLGNRSDNRLKLGSIESNFGCLMAGDGKGGFKYVSQPRSGLQVKSDVKSVVPITIDGKKYIIIGARDQGLQTYQVK